MKKAATYRSPSPNLKSSYNSQKTKPSNEKLHVTFHSSPSYANNKEKALVQSILNESTHSRHRESKGSRGGSGSFDRSGSGHHAIKQQGNKSTIGSHSDITLNSNRVKSKLLKADVQQLEEYMKVRDIELDTAIAASRKKLNLTLDNKEIDSFLQDKRDQLRNSQGSSQGQGQAERRDLYEDDPDLDQYSKLLSGSKLNNIPLTEHEKLLVKNLFNKLRMCIEEAKYSPEDILKCFRRNSPSSGNDDILLPIDDFTHVLQIDFFVALSPSEKKTIQKFYEQYENFINVSALLSDSGCVSIPNIVKERKSTRSVTPTFRSLPSSNPPPAFKKPVERVTPTSSQQVPGFNSETRKSALNDIHQLVASSLSDDFPLIKPESSVRKAEQVDQVPDSDLSLLEQLRAEADREKTLFSKTREPIPAAEARVGDALLPEEKPTPNTEVTKSINELEAENKRLKDELNHFNADFLQEINDLKYKYTVLKDVVGDVPPSSHSISGEPLQRLAWATKRSIRAMDRAALGSPITRSQTHLITGNLSPGRNSHSRSRSFSPTRLRSAPTSLPSHLEGSGSNFRLNGLVFGNDSFSSLCERRLIFELQSLPNPATATRDLIYRCMDLAGKNEEHLGFISCEQLTGILYAVGITMSKGEIELLASGFASDGKGFIDAEEFCRAIQTLMYNSMDVRPESNDDLARKIIYQLCYSILQTSDLLVDKLKNITIQKSDTSSSSRLYQAIKSFIDTPFRKLDDNDNDILTAKGIARALEYLYPDINGDDVDILIEFFSNHYGVVEGRARYSSSNTNLYDGASRNIAFPPIVELLTEQILEILGESSPVSPRQGRSNAREVKRAIDDVDYGDNKRNLIYFEFIDGLVAQLDDIPPSQKRKMLITLHHHLLRCQNASAGSGNNEIDGTTFLKCLHQAGFHLSRELRTKFLSYAESTPVEYLDICKILMSSCVDWHESEKHVFSKILHAMGVTINERHTWLVNFKSLMQSTFLEFSRTSAAKGMYIESYKDELSLPPSLFLSCLRESGISLTVDEEATLLDALDFERSVFTRSQIHSASLTMTIQCSTFIAICSRYAGPWYECSSSLFPTLENTFEKMTEEYALDGLSEIATLFDEFDDSNNGSIPYRSFLVCCRRSKLLTTVDLAIIESAAKELSDRNTSGTVNYYHFLLFLRAVYHRSHNRVLKINNQAKNFELLHQLLENCQDSYDGTLRPLRQWFAAHLSSDFGPTDDGGLGGGAEDDDNVNQVGGGVPLSDQDLEKLLREFGVVHSTDDLRRFQEDATFAASYSDILARQLSEASLNSLRFYLGESPHDHDNHHPQGNMLAKEVSANKVIYCLQQVRPDWAQRNPALANKLRSIITRNFSTESFKKLNNRLKTFATFYAVKKHDAMEHQHPHTSSSPTFESDYYGKFLDANSFKHILNQFGIKLSDEELYILTDECDSRPGNSVIRSNILLELMSDSPDFNKTLQEYATSLSLGHSRRSHGHGSESISSLEFALGHLRELILRSASKNKKEINDFIKDIVTTMQAYELGGGIISEADFLLSLKQFSIRLSEDILQVLPRVSTSIRLLPYEKILNLVANNSHAKRSHDRSDVEEHQQTIRKRETNREEEDDPVERNIKVTSVITLIDMIRKRLGLFVKGNRDVEEAWNAMLKVFYKFDPDSTNTVTPRDFCLAVNVLMSDDCPLLSKADWENIVFFYRDDDNKIGRSDHPHFEDIMVNYVKFLDQVLDAGDLRDTDYRLRSKYSRKAAYATDGNQQTRRSRSVSPRGQRSQGKSSSQSQGHFPYSDFEGRFNEDFTESEYTSANRYDKSSSGKRQPIRSNNTTQGFTSRMNNSLSSSFSANEYSGMTTKSRGGNSSTFNKLAASASFSRPSSANKSRTASSSDFGDSRLNKTTTGRFTSTLASNTQGYKRISAPPGVEEGAVLRLNDELENALSTKMVSTSTLGTRSMKSVLVDWMQMEDKNKNGILSKHSFLAALSGLGVNQKLWSYPEMKSLLDYLMNKGNGHIVVKDFMKLVFI